MQKTFDYLNDFLAQGIHSKLAQSLKCEENEIRILQIMLDDYLSGIQESSVKALISKIFNPADKNQTLDYLIHFQKLFKMGYITENSFIPLENNQAGLLELLYCDISLSVSFLRLLEGRDDKAERKEITPYDDPLEYLKDQFFRLSLIQKLSGEKSNAPSKTLQVLKLTEENIHARLKITKTPIPLERLITDYQLNPKEEIIFFALLKEEYSGGNENLRDMNSLIELISQDEYEKIKNRALLDEHGTLLEKKLLDYDELLNPFGGFSRTFYIREEILQKILHPKQKNTQTKLSLQNFIKDQEIFELINPKVNLRSVVLPQNTLELFRTIIHQTTPEVAKLLKLWGIKDKKGVEAKIIFYGASGTGKSMSALALAKELKRQVLSLDCSKILSMYIGESEKNVRKIFDDYKEISKQLKNPPILLLDEADQFLSLRGASGSGAEKMHNQMQNIFLEQIEKFEGILIATTNLLENIDSAFSRRFNYKVEFKRPDLQQRIRIWEQNLPKNTTFKGKDKKTYTSQNLAKELAHFPLSGAQIVMVIKNTAYTVALKTKPIFEYEDFLTQIQKEIKNQFDEKKNLGFVI